MFNKLKQCESSETKENASGCFDEALPLLKNVPISDEESLFIRKLNLCCVTLDFTDERKNLKEKDIKRQILLELVDYVSSVDGMFSDSVMLAVINTISINMFRVLTFAPRENTVSEDYDSMDEESSAESSWPHLKIVYKLLLRFVASPHTNARVAKRYIDQSFILKLLQLFDSKDPRERNYLKTILHGIYSKFMFHRPFIRNAIKDIFTSFIFKTEKHHGIAELLEFLGSVIEGFNLPLKEEHKLFLVEVLIPLHKPECLLPKCHKVLSYCITLFVKKESELADAVIRDLLKYWPLVGTTDSSSKEVLLLGELEDVLEASQSADLECCMALLSRQITHCLTSSHHQVAERTLMLWNNDHIWNLMEQNRRVILPNILPALQKLICGDNQELQSLSTDVLKKFSDADFEFFKECLLMRNPKKMRFHQSVKMPGKA